MTKFNRRLYNQVKDLGNCIIATYNVEDTSQQVKLIDSRFYGLNYIYEMYVDENPPQNVSANYKFDSIGPHTVRFMFNDDIVNLNYFFNGCVNLIDVSFKYFKCKNIKLLYNFLNGCSNIKKLNLNGLFVENVTDARGLCSSMTNLTEIIWDKWDLKSIQNFGAAFYFDNNLKSIDLSPLSNSSNLTDITSLFFKCESLREIDFSKVNFTNIKKMGSVCFQCSNVERINFGNVICNTLKEINKSFLRCYKLKSIDLTGFIGSKLTNIEGIFGDCYEIESINMNGFDITSVEKASGMFSFCRMLKSIDLSSFGENNKIKSINNMFIGCKSIKSINIPNFIPTICNDYSNLFRDCFELEILNINDNIISNECTTVANMLCRCKKLAINLDFSNSTTNKLLSMNNTFRECYNIPSIKIMKGITNLTDISDCFNSNKSLVEIDLSNITSKNIQSFGYTFNECINIKAINLINADTKLCTNFNNTFYNCQNLSNLIFPNMFFESVESSYQTFNNCKKLTDIDLSYTSSPLNTDITRMFGSCESLISLKMMNNINSITKMDAIFERCISLQHLKLPDLSTATITSLSYTFTLDSSLIDIDFSGLSTNNVTNFQNMFYGCKSLKEIKNINFEFNSANDTSSMFQDCNSLTVLDLSGTEAPILENMKNMFNGCYSISVLKLMKNISSVKYLDGCFGHLHSMTNIDLSNIVSHNLISLRYTFHDCNNLLKIDLTNFNGDNITDINNLFSYCNKLNEIIMPLNVNNITDYSSMFNSVDYTGTLTYSSKYKDKWDEITVTNQSISKFPSEWNKIEIP